LRVFQIVGGNRELSSLSQHRRVNQWGQACVKASAAIGLQGLKYGTLDESTRLIEGPDMSKTLAAMLGLLISAGAIAQTAPAGGPVTPAPAPAAAPAPAMPAAAAAPAAGAKNEVVRTNKRAAKKAAAKGKKAKKRTAKKTVQ
jgi:hypothetical protein